MKRVKEPLAPTEEEMKEHNITHIPFRAWCKHCINGRAVNSPHKVGEVVRRNGIAIVGIDYMGRKRRTAESEQQYEEENW